MVDDDEEARRVAASLGATALRKDEWDPKDRYFITVDASGHVPDLQRTIQATASGGTCTSVAIYFSRHVPIPLLAMYGKGIRFVTGRISAPPCIHEVLGLACDGKLHPGRVTTRVAPWQDAHVAFLENTPKVVVARKEYLQSAKS
ncbi:hypothetical protein MTX19_34705 [Bradyrhizobium sp. ISRA464]|nr:hypothetical protein MTX22_37255 [Bradyrhizobium sp. ISRA463]WGS26757.1 hypothetical protein MTX19_34705 [Bradyrhizobium sp. ISRA464]